jgi:hypothetical protein
MRLSLGFIAEEPQRVAYTVISTVVCVAVMRYFVGALLDWSVHLTRTEDAIADAATAGILAGAVMYVVLRSARKRRMLLLNEMSRIADLNHQVRNSLQVILGTELLKKDTNLAVVASCERIQETIERLFPMVGVERRRKGMQPSPKVARAG